MPSPVSAYDLIKASFRKAGITAAGETPTADEANDALSDLNDILEEMTTENLFVWGAQVETFSTTAGQASRTIGPTGNFVTDRPVRIVNAYCTFSGVDFPIDLIGQEEYSNISLKTMTQPIIEKLVYINDFPNGILMMWPVPSQAIPLVLNIDRVLDSVPSLATTLTMPPGYMLYLTNELAIRISPEYGYEPSPVVIETARSMKAKIKRANQVRNFARFDEALGCGPPVIWQTGG